MESEKKTRVEVIKEELLAHLKDLNVKQIAAGLAGIFGVIIALCFPVVQYPHAREITPIWDLPPELPLDWRTTTFIVLLLLGIFGFLIYFFREED